MKPLEAGDSVYIIVPGYYSHDQSDEPAVVLEHVLECGVVGIADRMIPKSVVCRVPEGHVFAHDLGTTGSPNPCLACGMTMVVPYKGQPGLGWRIADDPQQPDDEEDGEYA